MLAFGGSNSVEGSGEHTELGNEPLLCCVLFEATILVSLLINLIESHCSDFSCI